MVSSLSVVWQNQRVPQRVQRVHQRLGAVAFSRILRMTCPTAEQPRGQSPKVKPEVLSQVVVSQVVVWSCQTRSPVSSRPVSSCRLESSGGTRNTESQSQTTRSRVSSQVVVLKSSQVVSGLVSSCRPQVVGTRESIGESIWF
jgi:hypothetical protein